MSMNNWDKAKQDLSDAEKFLSLIGKSQRTTSEAKGTLHSLTVKTQIHHQETDGAKNYHECAAFDRALSTAIKNRFSELREEAIYMLRTDVSRTGIDARASVQRMLDQINDYETDAYHKVPATTSPEA